jgi:DNA-binding IclR family transcriptional regulator
VRSAESIAREIDTDPALLYRLLRALSSINLLREYDDGRFSISEGLHSHRKGVYTRL